MTNNEKIATSVAFTWHPERDVMGVWIACYEKDEPYKVAKYYRRWPGHTAFFSAGDITGFREIAQNCPYQERKNIERGLDSLTEYIKRAPKKFVAAFQ